MFWDVAICVWLVCIFSVCWILLDEMNQTCSWLCLNKGTNKKIVLLANEFMVMVNLHLCELMLEWKFGSSPFVRLYDPQVITL